MFELVAQEILERYAGKYVEGLEKKNLKIGVYSGESIQHNFESISIFP
jgi:hypothetical protein